MIKNTNNSNNFSNESMNNTSYLDDNTSLKTKNTNDSYSIKGSISDLRNETKLQLRKVKVSKALYDRKQAMLSELTNNKIVKIQISDINLENNLIKEFNSKYQIYLNQDLEEKFKLSLFENNKIMNNLSYFLSSFVNINITFENILDFIVNSYQKEDYSALLYGILVLKLKIIANQLIYSKFDEIKYSNDSSLIDPDFRNIMLNIKPEVDLVSLQNSDIEHNLSNIFFLRDILIKYVYEEDVKIVNDILAIFTNIFYYLTNDAYIDVLLDFKLLAVLSKILNKDCFNLNTKSSTLDIVLNGLESSTSRASVSKSGIYNYIIDFLTLGNEAKDDSLLVKIIYILYKFTTIKPYLDNKSVSNINN